MILFAILEDVNMLSLVTSVSENKTDQTEFSLPYACVSHSASIKASARPFNFPPHLYRATSNRCCRHST